MKSVSRVLAVTGLMLLGGQTMATEPKVIFEHDSTLLTTNIQILFLSGSIQEPHGKKGIANILSQILLRGTRNKSRQEFQREVEKLGATISAAAAHDRIGINVEVIQENTLKVIALIEDAVVRPAFDKKEFDQLKREWMDKIQFIKNSNGSLAGVALRKALYAGTPMELPEHGTLSTLKAIDLPDLVKYYNQYFTQANILVGVATPLEEGKVKKPLMKFLAQLPPGTKTPILKIEPITPAHPQLILVRKHGTETGTVFLGQKGITAQDELRYALGVGDYSFGGEPLVARLFKTIRSDLGWTYSIHSNYTSINPSYQTGIYIIGTTPSVEFTSKTLIKTLEMWKEYLASGLTESELELAQESLVNSYPFQFATAGNRLYQRLYSEIYGVPVLSPDEYEDKIRGIDNDKIKKALAARHTANGWMVSVVADPDTFPIQLGAEQKDVPEEKRLQIVRQIEPDELIR